MQTHRIPQHVTGYQSRIFGRLTPKQFIFIAFGGIAIFIILSTLPIGVITIIIVAFIALISFMFALMQIEDRSLDQWLLSFLIALQSTPQMVWKKESEIPEILLPTAHLPSKKKISRQPQKTDEKTAEFLAFWREQSVSDLTEHENEFLRRLQELETSFHPPATKLSPTNYEQ